MRIITAALACLLTSLAGLQAQIVLTGNYTQDFNSLGNATGTTSLPTGWSVTSNATSSTLGNLTASVDRSTWADNAGGARNVASTAGLASNSTATSQHSSSNRALGFRQGTSVGDPGAAFVFNFNSSNATISTISFDFLTLDVQTRTTTWIAQVSINGTSWTTLTTSPSTVTDAAAWGSTTVTISDVPTLVDNVSSGYFRLFASAASSGTGSRDTIAIDNFSIVAIPEPSTWILFGIGGLFMVWNLRRKRTPQSLAARERVKD